MKAGLGVIYGKYDGTELKYNDINHQLIKDDDVLLTYTGNSCGVFYASLSAFFHIFINATIFSLCAPMLTNNVQELKLYELTFYFIRN